MNVDDELPPDPFVDQVPGQLPLPLDEDECPECGSKVRDWRHFRGCVNDAAQVGPGILVEPERPTDVDVRVTLTLGDGQTVERSMPFPRNALLRRLDVTADGFHLLGIPFTAGGPYVGHPYVPDDEDGDE